MRPKILVVLITMFLFTACTESTDQKVLTAVKNYALFGKSLDRRLQERVDKLKEKGIKAEHVWIAPKLDENSFEVKAIIKAGNKKQENYVWALTEQPTSSKAKGSMWSLKAKSEAAKAMGRGQKWAGLGF